MIINQFTNRGKLSRKWQTILPNFKNIENKRVDNSPDMCNIFNITS